MKHLRRFFESVEISKEDILENFLYITDKLGEPNVYSNKFGDFIFNFFNSTVLING